MRLTEGSERKPTVWQSRSRLDYHGPVHDAIKPEPASGWMLPNTIGGALDLDNLADRVIKPVVKANGLNWKGWHAYRRGLATNLHELGIPDKFYGILPRGGLRPVSCGGRRQSLRNRSQDRGGAMSAGRSAGGAARRLRAPGPRAGNRVGRRMLRSTRTGPSRACRNAKARGEIGWSSASGHLRDTKTRFGCNARIRKLALALGL